MCGVKNDFQVEVWICLSSTLCVAHTWDICSTEGVADAEPESQVSTTLLAQDLVILIQEFSRYLPSSTCPFFHRPICPSFHQLIDIYVKGSRVFEEIFPTFKDANIVSQFCALCNPFFFLPKAGGSL